jgi:hypothetical protein
VGHARRDGRRTLPATFRLAENVERQATADLAQRQQRQQQAREAVRGVAEYLAWLAPLLSREDG